MRGLALYLDAAEIPASAGMAGVATSRTLDSQPE